MASESEKGADQPPQHLIDSDTVAFPLSEKLPPPAASTSYTLTPGTVLAGKYRVARTIGHGGMGVVVAARHLQLDIPVAMKLLNPEFVGSNEAVGRFIREARAASKLVSHHVTRMIDVGTLETGEPFMVMEYLAGEDLSVHAKAHKIPVPDVIDY